LHKGQKANQSSLLLNLSALAFLFRKLTPLSESMKQKINNGFDNGIKK